MSLHAAILHTTRYIYDRPVSLSPHVIRLRPAPHGRTPILGFSLKVSPKEHFLNWQQDPHGNWQARVVFPEKVSCLEVTVDLVADMAAFNPFDFFVEPEAEQFPFLYATELAQSLEPYRKAEPATPRMRALLDSLPRESMNTVDFVTGLNARVRDAVSYVIRMEPGVQSPEETLELQSGSCRDSAWLLVQLFRHLGLAARFVSGYLIQLRPDVKSLTGPSGPEADFTDLHAWTEVYLPGAGWIGLDPTSGMLAAEGHIPVSATPEPRSAAPISGLVEKCEVDFRHEMQVRRIKETVRVTKPYSDSQWEAIDALGKAVDQRLEAGDVRLTMGGEPTFIAADDPQGEEWNTGAVGPTKEAYAHRLIEELRERFAPGGLITYGQGKWYPGESLPRWAYSLYWRGDQQPIWTAPPGDAPPPADLATSERVMLGLAKALDLPQENVCTAYEDPWYFIEREQKLPSGVDVIDNGLDDPETRARLARAFTDGIDRPRGFAIPVARWQMADKRRWVSERWKTRANRLLLIPGDSAIGLRLPLNSLQRLDEGMAAPTEPREPALPHLPLPGRAIPPTVAVEAGDAVPLDEPDTPVRTSLAVEPREGFVNIFIPPLPAAADWLELVAAIDQVAAETGAPIRIEGYPPPGDHRLNVIKITPDPGVLEVNIHPASNWEGVRNTTMALYEAAHQLGLTTQKFLIDGRAVGTGGGNHVVMGAATPLDSPFLRRPDVLASMLRFWQNHPGLSYLFSGLFIGPTSQHPRVDEARDTALYDLELALAQIPQPGGEIPPWLVDRLLRNLLVDITGNTHRAEFCIDKLYAPESTTGRLGLVELRGFEMPPHPQMSLATQLLIRALVSWFWKHPYTRPLTRFGTHLHDRYMLPHYVWQDMLDVLAELRGAGYAFDADWFSPHFEFRFPRHGAVHFGDISLELRHALEPWPTMGETPGIGGTVRFVDSSVERLQVRATGLHGNRYSVACNGVEVPLTVTQRGDEKVGGVRYRAWQPAMCLHPTVGVQTPLTFDLYDNWNGRAVTGCTYHVAHPAGRSYEHFPVNGLEAESRRLARFETRGHTPGEYALRRLPVHPESPCTLDLRRGWS
jgi:uncharacterized protein (DUF2126 family)/transglutaminase-like putative cysteine protease